MALKETADHSVGDRVNPLHVFGVCTLTILTFIAVDLAFFVGDASFKREGGGLENASAFLYAVAALLFFSVAPKADWRRLWHIPALLTFFALRELDFDKAFTPAGILSAKLYSGDASLVTKICAGSVAVFFVWTVLRTARRGAPAMWRGFRKGAQWPAFAATAAFLVVATKSIDGLGRKLLDFGIVISNDVDAAAALVEEVCEAFIPVFAIMAILARWRGGIHDRNTSGSPSAD